MTTLSLYRNNWFLFLFIIIPLLSCTHDGKAIKIEPTTGGPGNPSFEEATINDRSSGKNWFGPQKEYVPHYEIKIGTSNAYEGKQYAEVYSTGVTTGREFGNIMQFIDASPYRGKTVRFRACG